MGCGDSCRCLVVAALLLVPCVASAANCHASHGHDFTYLESRGDDTYDSAVYAPVIIDMGRTYQVLRNYYITYGWDGRAMALDAVRELVEEASSHGVGFANVRNELRGMSEGELSAGPRGDDDFVRVAEVVRSAGMHIIAGGLSTDVSPAAASRNSALLLDYLAPYLAETEGEYPGELLGVFGFDEPDARFEGPSWRSCECNREWLDLVVATSEAVNHGISEDVVPFGTFLDRWNSRDGTAYYERTIPLFCGALDFPVFDKYPCKFPHWDDDMVEPRSFTGLPETCGIIGATDLLPSDDVHYDAYTGQDEVFLVDRSGRFSVYAFANVTSRTEELALEGPVYSCQVPQPIMGSGPVWGASDFRTADIGDRSTGEHVMNGAVVIADPESPSDNVVFMHDGSGLTCVHDRMVLPEGGFLRIELICVGQANYPVRHPEPEERRGTVIGQSEPVVLVCSSYLEGGSTVYRVQLFGLRGGAVVPLQREPIELQGPAPSGAVWGIFWPTRLWWHAPTSEDQSGFVLYREDGVYNVVYEIPGGDGEPVWRVSQPYDDLAGMDGELFVTRRTHHISPYACGPDLLCSLAPVRDDPGAFRLLSTSGLDVDDQPGDHPRDGLQPPSASGASNLPGGYRYGDITGVSSWRPYHGYQDALLLSLAADGVTSVFGSTDLSSSYPDQVSITEDALLTGIETAGDVLLASARVHSVREPYRIPLVSDPDGSPGRITMPQSDIAVENDEGRPFADYATAVERMFDLGIAGTGRSNCLIPNVRCEGRRQDGQLTYYPPADTLLYLMTTGLVHGARGLHIRMLEMSLYAGNGGEESPAGRFRFPGLLLRWGPGVDDDNVDILSRVLGVVADMTGAGSDGPDFLEALASEEWSVLDGRQAFNARPAPGSGGLTEDRGNDYLDFLALEHGSGGDVLLLVVNDSPETLEDDHCIRIAGRSAGDYREAECVAGFEGSVYGTAEEDPLALSFRGMPAYTASLFVIERR